MHLPKISKEQIYVYMKGFVSVKAIFLYQLDTIFWIFQIVSFEFSS